MNKLILLGFLFGFLSAEISIKTLCKRIEMAESDGLQTNKDGSLVTNKSGDRFGCMQIGIHVISLYNRITGNSLPLTCYTNEHFNRIIGYWYIRYLVAIKKNKYKAANSFNMGPNRMYANPPYLFKVFGHTNFLKGLPAIGYWEYGGQKYPGYKNFP